MELLENGVVTITGAGSGIGRATALAFARDGCQKLLLGDVDISGLDDTNRLIRENHPDTKVIIKHVDVSREQSVNEFYSTAVTHFGRIDYAANIAGISHPATPLHLLDDAAYDKMYAVNQRGAFLCEREVIRQMLSQPRHTTTGLRGSIVVVTSSLAEGTCNGLTAYCASKAGARGFCRSDALDYGPEGIRINTVEPGPTNTPMINFAQNEEIINSMIQITPLKRLGQSQDIANAIVWLSSNRAAHITGVSLIVDGGYSLQSGPD